MSKPFMFHFAANLYTIFYSRNFFRNFFLKIAKKFSLRKRKLSFLCYKTYFCGTRAKKTPKAGRLSELIFSRAQSLRND